MERAIEDYNEGIRLEPENALSYNSRWVVDSILGRHEEAIKDFEQGIRFNSQFAQAYNNSGFSYNHLGQPQKAIEQLDEAIRLDPEFAQAYTNRAVAHIDLGHPLRAIEDFDQAIWIDPQYARAYFYRGTTYSNLGQPERAIEDFNEAARLDAIDPVVYYSRGVAYANMGQTRKAIEDYDQAIRLNPRMAGILQPGRCLQRVGAIEQGYRGLRRGRQAQSRLPRGLRQPVLGAHRHGHGCLRHEGYHPGGGAGGRPCRARTLYRAGPTATRQPVCGHVARHPLTDIIQCAMGYPGDGHNGP